MQSFFMHIHERSYTMIRGANAPLKMEKIAPLKMEKQWVYSNFYRNSTLCIHMSCAPSSNLF